MKSKTLTRQRNISRKIIAYIILIVLLVTLIYILGACSNDSNYAGYKTLQEMPDYYTESDFISDYDLEDYDSETQDLMWECFKGGYDFGIESYYEYICDY